MEKLDAAEMKDSDTSSDSLDNIPLIKLTTRKTLLIRHKARKNKTTLIKVKKSIKGALKILQKKANSFNRRDKEKRRKKNGKLKYDLRETHKKLPNILVESDLDDSGDDYKPTKKDINSSDSESHMSFDESFKGGKRKQKR